VNRAGGRHFNAGFVGSRVRHLQATYPRHHVSRLMWYQKISLTRPGHVPSPCACSALKYRARAGDFPRNLPDLPVLVFTFGGRTVPTTSTIAVLRKRADVRSIHAGPRSQTPMIARLPRYLVATAVQVQHNVSCRTI